jgi:cell division protein FtsB
MTTYHPPPKTQPPRNGAPGRGFFSSRLVLVALIPLALYATYAVAERTVQIQRLRQETAMLRAEIEAEKRENLRLQQELVEARSDQQVEDAARRELILVRPGDNPVVVSGLPPRPTPTPRPAVRPDPPERMADWLAWLLDRLGL